MFHDAECAARFLDVWRGIAARFCGNADVIYGYDLVNEPVQRRKTLPGCDGWTLQRRAAEAIREIDPETPVIVESNLLDHPEPYGTKSPLDLANVINEVHVYNPVDYHPIEMQEASPDDATLRPAKAKHVLPRQPHARPCAGRGAVLGHLPDASGAGPVVRERTAEGKTAPLPVPAHLRARLLDDQPRPQLH